MRRQLRSSAGRRLRPTSALLASVMVTGTAMTGLAAPAASAAKKPSTATLMAASHPFKGPVSSLKPYNPNLPAGPKPPTSIPKVIAFANQADTGFFLAFQNAGKLTASKYGISTIVANAAGDAATQLTQVNTFLQRGIGALEVAPVTTDLGPEQLKAINEGIYVTVLGAGYPATTSAFASQYLIGYTQGVAAAKYIDAHLGGKAQVVYINANKLSPVLIARQQGAVAGMRTGGPGVDIVADVFNVPGVVTGEQLMSSQLEAHPGINVVVGDDESVLGAWDAFKAAGKASQAKYLSGVNGSPDALSTIAAGNTPYKADFVFGYGVVGYLWSLYYHRWLEGESVPLVQLFRAVELSNAAQIKQFNKDETDPAAAQADQSKYMENFGDISWSTRMNYVDYQPISLTNHG